MEVKSCQFPDPDMRRESTNPLSLVSSGVTQSSITVNLPTATLD